MGARDVGVLEVGKLDFKQNKLKTKEQVMRAGPCCSPGNFNHAVWYAEVTLSPFGSW